MTLTQPEAHLMSLDAYVPLLGARELDELRALAAQLSGRTVQMVNSTAMGGGVAEILNRLIPLIQELGLRPRWDVITGGEDFFEVTKAFHNALHGGPYQARKENFDLFLATNEMNRQRLQFDCEFTVIHDPQPVALIEARSRQEGHWIWRCHIDLSNPNPEVWGFLRSFVYRYDGALFSSPEFARQLPIPQYLSFPCIDPLSEKNVDLDPASVQEVVERFGIDPARPIITQISRFDRLKDPIGVMRAYQIVRRYMDCQLVLAGGSATDDPEGEIASTVIVQKSLREGFGLTVTEALWKKKPVVASAVGGIPAQVIHKHTGLLVHSVEGTAYQIRFLLSNPALALKLGEQGHEHVRENFLITTNVKRYLTIFLHSLQRS